MEIIPHPECARKRTDENDFPITNGLKKIRRFSCDFEQDEFAIFCDPHKDPFSPAEIIKALSRPRVCPVGYKDE